MVKKGRKSKAQNRERRKNRKILLGLSSSKFPNFSKAFKNDFSQEAKKYKR
tara:strand:+ start:104 stop:256 length:153 start_codon:yes stop_codon:yes gene_type:complete